MKETFWFEMPVLERKTLGCLKPFQRVEEIPGFAGLRALAITAGEVRISGGEESIAEVFEGW